MLSWTVLVLGAGASSAYGYPTGNILRKNIIDLCDRINPDSVGAYSDELKEFGQTFNTSDIYSIDAFLARRPEFIKLGKKLIAYTLLHCEDPNLAPIASCTDRWYQWLLNIIARPAWDDLDLSKLSIITFNYDRSLEYYLLRALKASYGANESDVINKLLSIRIVHVYGFLGPILTDKPIPYGCIHGSLDCLDLVQDSANRINIIPEGRDNSPELVEASELLTKSEKVAFLGFGFDETNVRRLGVPDVFRRGQNMLTNIGGTTFNASPMRRMSYAEMLTYGKDERKSVMSNLEYFDCSDFFQKTLFLEGRNLNL